MSAPNPVGKRSPAPNTNEGPQPISPPNEPVGGENSAPFQPPAESQRIQLLRHYAAYFPKILFVCPEEAWAYIESKVDRCPRNRFEHQQQQQQSSTQDSGAEGGSTDASSSPGSRKSGGGKMSPAPSGAPEFGSDPDEPPYKLEEHLYVMQQIVGRNQGTAAFVAHRLADGLKVIAKIILLNDDKQTAYAHSEVQCLAGCSNFGIVKHYDDFEREDKVLLVMEYGSGGDLNKQIKQRTKENLPFKEHEVGLLFYQIVLALDHVHRHRMIHRDLKSANIFLMPTGVIKLGDFGFSKQYGDTVSLDVGTSFCGTPYYLPPEIWERRHYSKKADMWSLGVILYELLTLQRPFKGPSQREIMQQVLYGTFDPYPENAVVSEEMHRFVGMLLSREAHKRPTTKELLQSEFLKYVGTIFEEIVSSSDVIFPSDKAEILQSLKDTRMRQSVSPQLSSAGATNPDAHYEGYLLKLSSDRRWKKRYFTLKNRQLRISLTETPEKDNVTPQAVGLDLINDVLPVPAAYCRSHPHQLVVWFSNGKKIVARADTIAERDMWIQTLHGALGMN